MSEYFGYIPDENGDITFRTVTTTLEVNSFEDYQRFCELFIQMAEKNPGVMPIVIFDDESGS